MNDDEIGADYPTTDAVNLNDLHKIDMDARKDEGYDILRRERRPMHNNKNVNYHNGINLD